MRSTLLSAALLSSTVLASAAPPADPKAAAAAMIAKMTLEEKVPSLTSPPTSRPPSPPGHPLTPPTSHRPCDAHAPPAHRKVTFSTRSRFSTAARFRAKRATSATPRRSSGSASRRSTSTTARRCARTTRVVPGQSQRAEAHTDHPILKHALSLQGFRSGGTTCWPSGLTVASTWSMDAMSQWGTAMGGEFYGKGANVQLGPGVRPSHRRCQPPAALHLNVQCGQVDRAPAELSRDRACPRSAWLACRTVAGTSSTSVEKTRTLATSSSSRSSAASSPKASCEPAPTGLTSIVPSCSLLPCLSCCLPICLSCHLSLMLPPNGASFETPVLMNARPQCQRQALGQQQPGDRPLRRERGESSHLELCSLRTIGHATLCPVL